MRDDKLVTKIINLFVTDLINFICWSLMVQIGLATNTQACVLIRTILDKKELFFGPPQSLYMRNVSIFII